MSLTLYLKEFWESSCSGILLRWGFSVCFFYFLHAVVLIRNSICSSNQCIDFPPANVGQTEQICFQTWPQIKRRRTNPLCVCVCVWEQTESPSSDRRFAFWSGAQDGCYCSLAFDYSGKLFFFSVSDEVFWEICPLNCDCMETSICGFSKFITSTDVQSELDRGKVRTTGLCNTHHSLIGTEEDLQGWILFALSGLIWFLSGLSGVHEVKFGCMVRYSYSDV